MNAADEVRLASWAIEIVEALLPGVNWRDEGDERRALGHGGLLISRYTGTWYDHSAEKGGRSPLGLIAYLKGCGWQQAITWAETWLANHPGFGAVGEITGSDAPLHNAAYAKQVLDQAIDVTGTPGETYFRSRGIVGEIPAGIKFLHDARVGEHAVVGVLIARGRTVGIQLGYIDPYGRKTTTPPARQRFMLEKAPDAAFVLASDGMNTFVCEGLEDMASIAALGQTARIIGLPGIGALKHLPVQRGTQLVVVRDGDESGSSADQALIAGVDHLLLEGAIVKVTATPEGQDANSILQLGGTAALAELIAGAIPASLSPDGDLARLARLSKIDYDKERKRHDVRTATLDAEVASRRGRVGEEPAEDPNRIELLDEDVDIGATLDEIVRELGRYIVTSQINLATTALWCAHTHLVHHPIIQLPRSPRLAIQARTPGSGKTTNMEAISELVPKPRLSSSVTASTVLRTCGVVKPTYMIDEVDQFMHGRCPELIAVLNSGDRRKSAFVERSVPTPDGGWVVERFSTWCAMAFSGIGELPLTLQDRSIIIRLHKAIGEDIKEHLEDGTSAELTLLKRKLATWAASLNELTLRPVLPEMLMKQGGRTGDNWRPFIAIADLAGGRWPELARQAALEAIGAEGRQSRVERLLSSIREAFTVRVTYDEEMNEKVHDERILLEKLPTEDLINALLEDREEEWDVANRGKPITAYWLRDNLRHLLDPPGTRQWEDPAEGGRRGNHRRGYESSQFARAWRAHLPISAQSNQSGVSGASGEPVNIAGKYPEENSTTSISSGVDGQYPSRKFLTPDEIDAVEKYTRSDPIMSDTSPHTPNTPDGSEDSRNTRGNGTDRRLTQLEIDIIKLAEQNPSSYDAQIAKRFGQPKAVVAKALGR